MILNLSDDFDVLAFLTEDLSDLFYAICVPDERSKHHVNLKQHQYRMYTVCFTIAGHMMCDT